MMNVSVSDYKRIEGLHPYREAALAILVVDQSFPEGYLPGYELAPIVNSKEAVWKSEQGFGYNALLGNAVCTRNAPNEIRCRVESDDKLILQLELNPDMPRVPAPTPSTAASGCAVRLEGGCRRNGKRSAAKRGPQNRTGAKAGNHDEWELASPATLRSDSLDSRSYGFFQAWVGINLGPSRDGRLRELCLSGDDHGRRRS